MSNGRKNIDLAARDRVMDEIQPFIDCLDEAIHNPSDQAMDELREAADKLMRAIANVIIQANTG